MFYSHFIKTRIFKSIAIFLIVSFVFVEFGFAQEDYSAHEQHADYGGFIPYAQAQRLMEADAATVDKLNAIENARSRFTVKTADNQDLLYVDDVIAAAKDAEGNIVFDPVFDDENNLQDGRVILADGTVQFYQDGKLVKAYTTYGTFLSYSDDGLITKETFPDGAESFYVYEKDEHGTIIKVSVQSGAAAATYDKDGKPINIIKADGTEYCYENGVLRSIASADGTIYRYTPIVEDGKTKSVLSEIAYADGSVLTVTDHTITALQCTPSDFAVNTTNVTGSINTYYNAEINKDVLTIESPNNSSFGVKYTQQASFTSVFDNLSLAVKSTNNTYFYIQVNVKGADGQNYTIYYQAKTGQDSISGNKLYRKLGTHLLSGNWVDLALDISGDLQKAFNTSLASIKQLYLRGNMEAADIKAYNLAVSCANSFTVPLTGWRIYTSKTGEYFEETDLETGAAIIRLSSGFNTSFGVRYPVNNYLGCPNEKLSLSVKAGRDFLLKYKILAADGKYYTIVYRPGSRASYVSGTTAYYYLGNDLLNNAWHDITRNLRSDLQQAFGVDFLFATDSFICGGDISVRDMTLSQGLGYDAPLFVTYGDSAEVEEALSIEGKLLTITNGLIGSAHDVLRNTSTLFSYETSAGVLGGFSLTTNGITTAYDATGTLTGILLPDGTGINFTADFTIENFFTANNIVLDDFLLDTQGIGENKTHLPNGAVCVYEDGELKQITTPGGLIYVFSKSEQDGKIFFIASLDRETTPSRLLTDEAPSSLIYDEGRILVCIVQENGVTTSLVDGKIVSKMAADGSITSYSYTYNDAGDLTGIKVEDAVSVTWYDGQGVAFKACAKGSDGAPDVTSEYAYGKIRKVFSGETLIYEYEYEFVDGSEVVVVKDIENSVTKRYCDGRLLTQVNQDGIVTRYEYDAQGRISKAEVVLNGKVLHSYQYSYSGDFTAILDEDGTLRTYSPDKKLYRLKTKEGFVYEYAYLDDGEEISIPEGSGIDPQSVYSSLAQPSSIATLNQIELLTGEIVRLGGTLPSSLVLPDGTLLRDLTFDESRQLIKAVVADGEYDIVLLFNNGAVTEKDYPDGSALYYDENGRIIKAETFEGLTYEYTYADDGTLQEITVQDGDAVVKFDGEGNQIASFHTDMSQLPSQAGWTYYGDTGEGSVASIVDGNAVINTTNGGATNRAYYYAKQYFLDNARGWKVSFRFTLDPKTASTDPKVEFNINDGARRLRMKFYPNAIIIKAPSDDNPVSLEYPVSDGFHTYTVEGKGTDFLLYIDGALVYEGAGLMQESSLEKVIDFGDKDRGIDENSCSSWDFIDVYNFLAFEPEERFLNPQENNADMQALNESIGAVNVTGNSFGSTVPVYDNVGIESFVLSDGTTLTDVTLDYDNSLKTACIKDNDAVKTLHFQNGIVTKIEYPDGTIATYGDDGLLKSITAADGVQYSYTYNADGTVKEIIVKDGLTTLTFDGQGNQAPALRVDMSQLLSTQGWTYYGDAREQDAVRIEDGKTVIDTTGLSASNKSYYYARQYYLDNAVGWQVNFRFKLEPKTGDLDPKIEFNIHDGARRLRMKFYQDGIRIKAPSDEEAQWVTQNTTDGFHTYTVSGKGTDFTFSIDGVVVFEGKGIMLEDSFEKIIEFGDKDGSELENSRSDWEFLEVYNTPASALADRYAHLDPSICDVSAMDAGVKNISEMLTNSSDLATRISYGVDSKIISTKKLNGTTELCVDGRPTQVIDSAGRTVTSYEYDADGNVTKITLDDAKRKLALQVELAKRQVAADKVRTLIKVAEERRLDYAQITVQFEEQKAQIQAAKENLAHYRYVTVERQAKKWFGVDTYSETIEVQEVVDALNRLSEMERRLNEEEAIALAALDEKVSEASVEVDRQAQEAFAEIEQQNTAIYRSIIKQEITPIVIDHYRELLGRDPSSEEYEYWVDKALANNETLDIDELRAELSSSAERAETQEKVARIKNAITQTLNDYIAGDDTAKTAILVALGFGANEAVALRAIDVEKITAWLDARGLHFEKSAVAPLYELLLKNHAQVDYEQLAAQAVLIDIFAGLINITTEGELELSMFALERAAALYNVALYPVKLEIADLIAHFDQIRASPAIVHVNENHYMYLVDITTTSDGTREYTLVDFSAGKDGEEFTYTEDEFTSYWQGYCLTDARPADETKIISQEEAQEIRGSFFPLLFWIVKAVVDVAVAVVSVAWAAITTASAVAWGVIQTVLAGIGNLMAFIGNSLWTMGKFAFSAVKFGFTKLLGGITKLGTLFQGGIFQTAGNAVGGGILQGIGGFVSKFLANGLVAGVLNYGVNYGLEKLGLNAGWASIASAFLTGGLIDPNQFLKGAFEGLMVQGLTIAGNQLGLDPTLSSLLSISGASLLTAGLFGGLDALSTALKKEVAPNLLSELANYGIQEWGESLGIDKRISQLAGIPLTTGIRGYLSGQKGDTIWKDIWGGTARGLTSVGIEWALEEADIDPLVGALSTSALTGAIEGMLEGQGLFKGIFDAYFNGAAALLTFGGPGTTEYARSLYISKIIDFSTIIKTQGLESAFETYATGILHRQTIESIYKQGGIIDLLTNNAEITVNREGQTVKRVYLDKNNKDTSEYLDFDLSNDNLRGYKKVFEDGSYEVADCEYGVGEDGNPKPIHENKTHYAANNVAVWTTVVKFCNLVKIELFKDGNSNGIVTPLDGSERIEFDEEGNFKNAKIISNNGDQLISIENGQETERITKGLLNYNSEDKAKFREAMGLTESEQEHIIITEKKTSSGATRFFLSYEQADVPKDVADRWEDLTRTTEGQERIYNAHRFLGYRTNTEIEAHKISNIEYIQNNFTVGDVYIFNGTSSDADIIKLATQGPANHIAMAFVDEKGEEWVLEMKGPWSRDINSNMRFTKKSEFLKQLENYNGDVEVGSISLSVGQREDMKKFINNNFFDRESVKEIRNEQGEVVIKIKDIPYNTRNLIGLNEKSKDSFICSNIIDVIYSHKDSAQFSLIDYYQRQISPVDIRNAIKQKGTIR